MSGLLLGTYRPFLTAPGIPGVDFPVGRTSTNPLSIAIVSTQTPLTGLSSTSVTIGTGAKTFTIAANQSNFTATDNITICSAANNSNAMIGTVTSYIGSTLIVNVGSVTGSGTFTDWCLAQHFVSQASFSGASPNILRHGSNTADFSVTDWDYRGVPCSIYLQNIKNISFSQCLFDLSGWTSAGDNQSFLGARSGTPTYSVTNCTFDGLSSPREVTSCLGSGLVTCDSCDIINWPLDFCDTSPTASVTTEIKNTRVTIASSTASGFGLHSDGMQNTAWPTGTAFSIHHTTISIPAATPPGGSATTSCLNFGTNTGDWLAPLTINNCIFIGGSYNLYHENKSDILATSAITYGANVYVSGAVNGPTFPAANSGCNFTNLTIPALNNAATGSPQLFTIVGLVSQSSIAIGNGTKTFTTIRNYTNLIPSAPITIFNPPASGGIVNSMTGTITSYDGTTLVCNITAHAGSGTFTEWGVTFSNILSYP